MTKPARRDEKLRRHSPIRHVSASFLLALAGLALGGTAALAAIASPTIGFNRAQAPQVSFPPPVPVPPPSITPLPAPMSRQQALESVRARRNVVLRTDRIEARLTTFGAVQAARGVPNDLTANAPPTLIVWVVAVGGDFRPQLARGEQFPWGVVVFDVTTGREVATFAGGGSPWPDFFDRLTDQGKP